MNIAIATSLFIQNNFDSFLTISYAKENNFTAVQFYMSPNIQNNPNTVRKIRELCENEPIKPLCHSPLYIGDVSVDKEHCRALSEIFPQEFSKYCIFHFDENRNVDIMINDCEKLVDFGIVPCIENFYQDKSRNGLVANIEKYLSFFDRVIQKNIPIIPVLDFPRLFVEQFTNYHPIFLSQLLIQKFAKRKIIIHAIDSVSPCQNRENWCAVGKGIVAYSDIFDFIKHLNVFVEYVVLEYENTFFVEESVRNLNKFCSHI
jgi:sugar phosphate isomerase/epimerase